MDMTGKTKKNDADDNVDEKTEAVKKPAASRKKIKAISTEPSEKSHAKKNIVEKLQGMGVMSGGKSDSTVNANSEHASILKLSAAVAVSTFIVGSFIWLLNKEATNERHASSADSRITPHSYPGVWQPSFYNPLNNPGNNNAAYNYEQQRLQKQGAQQQEWFQQQQAQEQQRFQSQNWGQQQPNQAQYTAQQQKWAQQQQQEREQQRAQQLKWAQQQKQAREQQRAQQKWAQQQQQQPYYGYSQYGNNESFSQPYYNYQPQYQQPGQYYRQ